MVQLSEKILSVSTQRAQLPNQVGKRWVADTFQLIVDALLDLNAADMFRLNRPFY